MKRSQETNGRTSSAEANFSVVISGTVEMERTKQRWKTRNSLQLKPRNLRTWIFIIFVIIIIIIILLFMILKESLCFKFC